MDASDLDLDVTQPVAPPPPSQQKKEQIVAKEKPNYDEFSSYCECYKKALFS